MKLVLNASPLIFLAKADALFLLPMCFTEIRVPPTVITEVRNLVLPACIQPTRLTPEGQAYVRGAMGRLHAGELEAMVLAREYHITHVALDDLLARNKAKQLGLTPIGTAGLLLLANAKGLISGTLVKLKLQALIERHGFYLSLRLLEKVQDMLVE